MSVTVPDRLSTPVYEIPWHEDTWIIYAPLIQVAFAADAFVTGILQRLRDGDGFIQASNEELEVLRDFAALGLTGKAQNIMLPPEPQEEYKPTTVHLDITPTCNLGCVYCYADARPQAGTMPFLLAASAIDLVCTNAVERELDHFGVVFLGSGEPLARWQQVTRVIEYAEQKAADSAVGVTFSLTTNGTLVTPARAEWLRQHRVFVSLSFDGLPRLQDKQRPMANGRRSLPMVEAGIGALKGCGVQYGLRATVTEQGISAIPEMIQYIKMNELGTNFNIELMGDNGRATSTVNMGREVAVALDDARRLGRREGITITNSISRALTTPRERFCQVEFAVSHRGHVSACHRFLNPEDPNAGVFFYGAFNDQTCQFEFDLERLNAVRGRGAFQYEDCQQCFARWNCAGDCLALRARDGVVSKHGPRCNTIRANLRYQIASRLGLVPESPASAENR